jgi:hypothetical protein
MTFGAFIWLGLYVLSGWAGGGILLNTLIVIVLLLAFITNVWLIKCLREREKPSTRMILGAMWSALTTTAIILLVARPDL